MNKVITIGREYGSGGREVGLKLAEKLGIPFYDKEIITLAAEQGGLNESFLAANEERSPVIGGSTVGRLDFAAFYQPSFSDKIFFEQSDVIRQLAEKPCVIVGRCADYVLRDSDCVSVFIYAGLAYKMERKRHLVPGMEDALDIKLEKHVQEMEKHRKRYYEHYTGRNWGTAWNYDLCICSDRVGVDGAVEIILKYLEGLNE